MCVLKRLWSMPGLPTECDLSSFIGSGVTLEWEETCEKALTAKPQIMEEVKEKVKEFSTTCGVLCN